MNNDENGKKYFQKKKFNWNLMSIVNIVRIEQIGTQQQQQQQKILMYEITLNITIYSQWHHHHHHQCPHHKYTTYMFWIWKTNYARKNLIENFHLIGTEKNVFFSPFQSPVHARCSFFLFNLWRAYCIITILQWWWWWSWSSFLSLWAPI